MFCRIILFITAVLLAFAPRAVGQQTTQPACGSSGSWENGVYTNLYLHLSYSLPDSWVAGHQNAAAPPHRFLLLDLPVHSVREAQWSECSLIKASDNREPRNSVELTALGEVEESEQEIATGYLRFMQSRGVDALHADVYSDRVRHVFFTWDFHDEHGRSPYSAIVVTKVGGIALTWYLYAQSEQAVHKLLDGVHSSFLD